MELAAIEKGGFEHFMLKEMMEIPETIENTMRGRLLPEEGSVKLGGLRDVLTDILAKKRIMITACGSASPPSRSSLWTRR